MKLNLKKCTFGIKEGTFLGYKVNTEGIMVCLDKVGVVLNLPSLKCLKDVQKLNGKLASLNRFLFKSAKKSLPFFKTLKYFTMNSDFQWTTEAEAAFKEMKKLIAELPTLTAPMKREELIMYLTAAREAVSVVLMTEREAKQMLIYFVSRALQGPEINYTSMEKLVLALVHASKRLKRYFQAYTIIVITDQPIKQILSRPEVTGRLQKWSIELDFIVERPEDDPLDTPIEAKEELPDPWKLFTDGPSCVDGSGASLILTNPKGAEFTYALRFRFDATSIEAEYEALLAGLRIAEQMGVLVEELKEKSINKAEVLAVVEEEMDIWMTPIYNYLTKETLHVEKEKARVVRRKSGRPYGQDTIGQQCMRMQEIDKGMSILPGLPPRAKKPAAKIDSHHIKAKPVATITETTHSKIGVKNYAAANAFVRNKSSHVSTSSSRNYTAKRRLILLSEVRDNRDKDYLEMKTRSNGDTPFLLTYGTKAVIPAEIGIPTMRTAEVDMVQNDEALRINLDLWKKEESKRRNEASHAKESEKLSPRWEGPYEVTEALVNGAYKLMEHNGKLLPQTWNIRNLKNVTYMKCKHPSHASLAAEGAVFEYIFSHVTSFINE
ncbi:reverse transcriptase domain-containing protein [Tanacetum coccineum]